MKPITWLRKFTERGFRGYPLATLVFYGPDDRKASKLVLGIVDSKVDQINQFRAEEGIPKGGQARARLATSKAQSES
jgi:hypothetical protein